MKRPNYFQLKNGSKAKLPFTNNEYESRLKGLREIISKNNLDAVILTSMQNIAYYSGFLYCSFGRPYACIVTSKSKKTRDLSARPIIVRTSLSTISLSLE